MKTLTLLFFSISAFAVTTPPTPLPTAGEWGYAVIGDPQYNTCAATPTASLLDCTNWVSPSLAQAAVWPNQISHIISQKTTYNLQFALFVGDLTDQTTAITYATTQTQLQRLVDAGIPVFSMPGNHDVFSTQGVPNYNNMFATLYSGVNYVYGRFGRATLAGAESVNGGYQNIAYSVTINGRPLLMLCVEYDATDLALDWAKGVEAAWLAANPRGRVWFATHDFGSNGAHIPLVIDPVNAWAAHLNTYWLAADTNIEVVFCGHWNMGFAAKGLLGPWTVVEQDMQSLGFGIGGDIGYYRVKRDGTTDGCVWLTSSAAWCTTDSCGGGHTSWSSTGCVTFAVQPWNRFLFPMPGGIDR